MPSLVMVPATTNGISYSNKKERKGEKNNFFIIFSYVSNVLYVSF